MSALVAGPGLSVKIVSRGPFQLDHFTGVHNGRCIHAPAELNGGDDFVPVFVPMLAPPAESSITC